ncbi:MAG TPA: DUF4411 family protein [Phycisphaerae bacterium]|nr:DUF4411 family protein [Phycisphaerae bacterium]
MRYSIDTSAILDGWRRHYPPEAFPALWDRIHDLIEAGDLIATEEVLYELEKQDDDVYAWALANRSIFYSIDPRTQVAVSQILRDHPRLVDTRKNRSGADPFVIALAKVQDCVVVTGEPPTNNPDRPNIPDVCRAMGVRCISLLQLVLEQRWVFEV